MKTVTESRRVGDLRKCPEIVAIRKIKLFTVNRYKQHMKEGCKFPAPVIDKKTNQIIAGNHIVAAYIEGYGNDHVIEVEVGEFSSLKDKIIYAIKSNIAHGLPLDTISRKRASKALQDLGVSKAEIADLLNIGVHRVEVWDAIGDVIIQGKPFPIKRGLEHMAGQRMSKADYVNHIAHDIGKHPFELMNQVREWMQKGLVNVNEPQNLVAAKALLPVLKDFVQTHCKHIQVPGSDARI